MPSLLISLLFLVLWLRLLPPRDERGFFNPYLAGVLNLADRIVLFLRPVLGMLPPYFVAALTLLFLLAFRGVVAAGAGLNWIEKVGLWHFAAPVGSPGRSVLFSFVTFLWLLHRVWTLEWVISIIKVKQREKRAGAALAGLAMPVSDLPPFTRGLFLLLTGALIGYGYSTLGVAKSPLADAGIMSGALPAPLASGTTLLVFSLGAIADVLTVSSHLVLVFIILSFIGALMRSLPTATIGNEGLDLIVGSVFSKPIQVGNFSLAPILFFLLAGVMHSLILGFLYQWLARVGI